MTEESKQKILKGIVLIAGMAFFLCCNPQSSFIIEENIPVDSVFLGLEDSTMVDETETVLVEQNTFTAISPLFIPHPQVLGTFVADEPQREVFVYTVEEGDNISSIASKFNVSTLTVLWANNLSSNSKIKVGQELIILPVTGVLHYVRQGESISGIASLYKADQQEIMAFNEVDNIMTGDVLIVPDGKKPTTAPTISSFAGWVMPARGVITQGLHPYNAVDVANNCYTTPIYAAAGGKIQRTGFCPIGGNYIRILHSNGVVTYYGHLSKILVSPGQAVSQGSVIGYMGNTGFTIGATGCHIHFEVRGATNPLARYRVGARI